MNTKIWFSTNCRNTESVFNAFNRLEDENPDTFPNNARLYFNGPGRPNPEVPTDIGQKVGEIRVRPNEYYAIYIPNN